MNKNLFRLSFFALSMSFLVSNGTELAASGNQTETTQEAIRKAEETKKKEGNQQPSMQHGHRQQK